jgi:hypothetical protein
VCSLSVRVSRSCGQRRASSAAVVPLKKSKREDILEKKSYESSMLISLFVVACVLPLISGQIPIPARPDGFSLGSPSAAIVIDAHVDLLCPYCAQAHPTLSALTQHYTQVWLLQPRRTRGIIAISHSISGAAACDLPLLSAPLSPQRLSLFSSKNRLPGNPKTFSPYPAGHPSRVF